MTTRLWTFDDWIENETCPVCGQKGSVGDIYDPESQHYKCIYTFTNNELRTMINDHTSPKEILDKCILDNKLRDFSFRRSWHNIVLTWTLPPQYEQLQLLASCTGFNKYLEVGAGTGFLAAVMQKMGFDFVAVTDIKPGNFQDKQYEPYCEMEALDYLDALRKYGDKTNVLLVCWSLGVEYNNELENLFKGQYIVHIGEDYGCTYFGELDPDRWELIETIKTPHWDGLRDRLEIYQRKQSSYYCTLM